MSEHGRDVNRRTFLTELAAVGVGAGALAALARAADAAPAAGPHGRGVASPAADQIGVQLYTVRDLLQKDFAGTLERVARIGYKRVEFAGYYDHTPEQVRALLSRLGLTAPSSHVGVPLLRQDLARQIASAKTIGHEYITVPSYPVPRTGAPLAAWKEAAAQMNGWATECQEHGLRFAYHNHDFEFLPVEGGPTGFDVLVKETDPSLVSFELDLYWATYAGQDPVRLFQRYPGRFVMWHVKDMRDPRGSKAMVPVGQGTIPFKRIFAHSQEAGMRYFFVEHDNAAATGGALASIQASYKYLRRLLA